MTNYLQEEIAALIAGLDAVPVPTPPPVPGLMEPQLTVIVAGQDVTDRVDYDSCVDIDSERGEASATIVIPVGDENEIPFNGLAQDAAVEIDRGGRTPWVGHVVRVRKPSGDEPKWVLDCAGGWADLSRSTAWCMGFVERDYAKLQEAPKGLYEAIFGKVAANIDVNLDGQVQFILPKGSKTKTDQSKALYYWPLDGLRAIGAITRITGKWTCAGSSEIVASVGACTDHPHAASITDYVFVSSAFSSSGSSGTFDSDDMTPGSGLDYADYKFLVVGCTAFSNVSETTGENFCQLTELTVYIDRLTAPTVDEIVVAIDADARPDGETASSATVGSAQAPFMCDPLMTPADGIGQALAKVATPPLCGIWQNRMTIKPRPSAPDTTSKLWIVSEVITPGLEWGVEIDEEQSVDYVGCSYSIIGDATYPDGTPRIAWYPATPSSVASERIGTVDGGERTAADAALYAQQAYYWMHRLPQGPVVVPYVVHDDKGVEWPAEAIRSWDWVQNTGLLDDELAGPHLISDVARQGGIATLTIGNDAAYQYTGPERLAQAGKYVRGHWQRTKRKEWAGKGKRPKGARWKKAANGRWWRWKLRWVEGKYV